MSPTRERTSSRLLSELPAIYQDNDFLSRFLLPIEAVVLGAEQDQEDIHESLEGRIDRLSSLFDPLLVSDEFLPWLGQWVAVAVDGKFDSEKQRQFMANIMHFYRWRGTKRNLQELLDLFLDGEVQVIEPDVDEFQIGVRSTIGIDTYLGQPPAQFFSVKIMSHRWDVEDPMQHQAYLRHQDELARTIIEMEKPAYTQYGLEFLPLAAQYQVNPNAGHTGSEAGVKK